MPMGEVELVELGNAASVAVGTRAGRISMSGINRATSKRTQDCGPHDADRPHETEVSKSAFERAAAIFRAAGNLARLRQWHWLGAVECCVTELADTSRTKLSTLSQ